MLGGLIYFNIFLGICALIFLILIYKIKYIVFVDKIKFSKLFGSAYLLCFVFWLFFDASIESLFTDLFVYLYPLFIVLVLFSVALPVVGVERLLNRESHSYYFIRAGFCIFSAIVVFTIMNIIW